VRKLLGISTTAFQHPMDIQAIEALKKLKGFDYVCHKMIEYGYERLRYIDLVANYVKVSSTQCPKIYEIFKTATEILDVPEPNLFIGQSPDINAYTSGAEHPFIVINSNLIDQFSDDELLAVIGHELGHIKCRHLVYTMVADFVRDFADAISGATFGAGGLLLSALELGLFNWYRKAELSCDRASLLVTQSTEPCFRVMMKLAGGSKYISSQMNIDDFIKQADLYADMDSDMLNKVYKFLLTRYQSHPYAVLRAKEIKIWAGSDQYKNILDGNYESEERLSGNKMTVADHMQATTSGTGVAALSAATELAKTGLKGLFRK
jgi:Zn-dependent protease with chaperone function